MGCSVHMEVDDHSYFIMGMMDTSLAQELAVYYFLSFHIEFKLFRRYEYTLKFSYTMFASGVQVRNDQEIKHVSK